VTPDQLLAFQACNRNHIGVPLKADGIQGPETEWSLDFATICRERRAIVLTAQTLLGIEEAPLGSNDEPSGALRRWLERCGAKRGDPWCAAFASRCIGARIASAQALGKAYPATSQPWPGDVMWFPTDGAHGHCGIVIGVDASEVMTIEGNLRHGVRVARRPRTGLRFSRVVDDQSGTCPGVVPSVLPAHGGTR
jgi:hypothetical protein